MRMFCRQVVNRLQKLGLCLSPAATLRLLGSLGEGHDEKIFEWQESLLEDGAQHWMTNITNSFVPQVLVEDNHFPDNFFPAYKDHYLQNGKRSLLWGAPTSCRRDVLFQRHTPLHYKSMEKTAASPYAQWKICYHQKAYWLTNWNF